MMVKRYVWILFLLLIFTVVKTATAQTDTIANEIFDADGIETVNKFYLENIANPTGYRLQLYTGTKQKPAHQIKAELITKYPEMPVYIVYEQPYFKVRVGNCYTKIEAWKLKNKLAENYPNSFIVKDEIEVCPE
jgi:hypothetical protein